LVLFLFFRAKEMVDMHVSSVCQQKNITKASPMELVIDNSLLHVNFVDQLLLSSGEIDFKN